MFLLFVTRFLYYARNYIYNFYNNNNDFFCANILEDQAQWRDKTEG